MESQPQSPFTLEINRILKAPPAAIWKCWTTPDLLMQWFCPRPWRVVKADMDLRVGGQANFLMQGPNGESFPNIGVYLALEENRRLVFTDAFRAGWIPSEKPFMVGEVLLSATPDNFTITSRAPITGMRRIWKAIRKGASSPAGTPPPISWRNWRAHYSAAGRAACRDQEFTGEQISTSVPSGHLT
jgi:uncharacterized protein YndB with AHSA1/START domain